MEFGLKAGTCGKAVQHDRFSLLFFRITYLVKIQLNKTSFWWSIYSGQQWSGLLAFPPGNKQKPLIWFS